MAFLPDTCRFPLCPFTLSPTHFYTTCTCPYPKCECPEQKAWGILCPFFNCPFCSLERALGPDGSRHSVHMLAADWKGGFIEHIRAPGRSGQTVCRSLIRKHCMQFATVSGTLSKAP